MKREKTSEPGIYRIDSNHFFLRVEGPRGNDGQRNQYTGAFHGTFDEAKLEKARIKMDLRGEVSNDARDMTLGYYWEHVYWPGCASLARSTRRGYRSAYRKHVMQRFSDVRLRDIKRGAIQRWIDGIDKPGAAKGAYKTLRQILRCALADEIIDRDPTFGVKLPRIPPYRPEVFKLGDVPRLLDAVKDTRIEPVILVSLGCGTRTEEVCALYWEDICFSKVTHLAEGEACDETVATVSINKTLQNDGKELVADITKNDRSTRIVNISGPIAKRLGAIASIGPLVPYSGDPRVDMNEGEDRESPYEIAKEYKALCSDAGLPWVSMQNLRHTCATLMRDSGVEATVIAQILGHNGTQMVYQHYFSTDNQAMSDAADSLGHALGSA